MSEKRTFTFVQHAVKLGSEPNKRFISELAEFGKNVRPRTPSDRKNQVPDTSQNREGSVFQVGAA